MKVEDSTEPPSFLSEPDPNIPTAIPIIAFPESLPIPEPMTAPTEASAAPPISKRLPLPYTAA